MPHDMFFCGILWCPFVSHADWLSTGVLVAPLKKNKNLQVDASFGSGHWYEGGGLYRDVTLIATSPHAHIVEDSFYAAATHADGAPRDMGWSIDPVVEIVDRTGGGCAGLTAVFSVRSANGTLVAQVASDARSTGTTAAAPDTDASDASVCTLRPAKPIAVSNPDLWTIQSPALYTATVEIGEASGARGQVGGDTVLDAKSATIGFRDADFTPDHGFWLNGRQPRRRLKSF